MKEPKSCPALNPARRRFILGAGASTAGLLAGKVLAGEKTSTPTRRFPEHDYDVIVIGGGMAGAAASRDCMENGYSTVLLEAKNRLGGRTFTADFDGDQVELGGFWIHHTQPFVWAEKERYDLAIAETPGATPDMIALSVDDQRQVLSAEQMQEAVMGWQAFTDAGREILPRNWDLLHNRSAALAADAVSVTEKLKTANLSGFQKQFIKALVATMANNHPDAMSYLELLRWHQCGGGYFPTFMDAVSRFYLKDGTTALIDKMIEDGGAEVRLSTPVRAIEDLGDKVSVTTLRGEKLTAAAVICSLPMNTIFNIDFKPALPSGVVEAGKQRHTGVGLKLYVKLRGDVGNLLSVANSGQLDYLMTYKRNSNYTIMVGFGRNPDALDVYDDSAVQKAVQRLVPGAELLGTISYDWNNDPYARGTYCSYRPGWVAKYYDDFQAEQGRIFFGASDHGEGWRGFIDGAIGGGIKAAQRVKERLA